MRFNAKITLNSATAGGEFLDDFTTWTTTFSVSDADVGYSGFDVAVGHMLLIDTSLVIAGTITRYVITSISSQDALNVEAQIALSDPTMEAALPDIGWAVGAEHAICSPTPRHLYATTPDPAIQGLPTKFVTYIRNVEFDETIDKLDPLPDQTGNSGKFLTTDGIEPSWATVSASVMGYIHTQASPSDAWSIMHAGSTMNAIVSIYDGDNNLILPDNVNIVSTTQIDVTFSVAMAGRAVVMLF